MKLLSIYLLILLLLLLHPGLAQRATFSTTTNVIVVNARVLDRDGNTISNLTKEDFELYEDGKPQKLQAVDFQRLSDQELPPVEQAPTSAPEPKRYNPATENAARKAEALSKYRDRRLIIILFDLSSMQPAEQVRAKEAAARFLRGQMTASDTVSIMSYATSLQTVQEFTADRDLLLRAIDRLPVGDSSENAAAADTGPDAQDQSGQFVADETEFNIFNADLKLAALEEAARGLAQFPEKKALVYISSGVQKNGVDNQSQLRATANTAIRANVAFYPIDARGLSALVPGGDATQAAAVGNNLYNGAAQRTAKENFNNQQETLATLALDTGGKALLDSNDLTNGFRQVQKDFGSYYVLTYVSSNPKPDGRYRRIQIKLRPSRADLRAKLDYRQGYFAPAAFTRLRESDKEAQLSQALLSGNPLTDLPMVVEIDYFRLAKDKYFVPVTARISGSALVFRKAGSKQATEMDFIAEVRDARHRPAATVRDTVPLKIGADVAGEVSRRSLQYDTGVTLAPGKYTLKFVARENGEGKVGTFESPFVVPDLSAMTALRTSSVVLTTGREPLGSQVAGVKNSRKLLANNPLLADGQKTVPNVTKVFRPGQKLLAYVEVYDPKVPDNMAPNLQRGFVQASLALYGSHNKVLETAPVRASRLSEGRDATLPVWLTLPSVSVPPGRYECQINLIDELGRKFAFPRTPVAVIARGDVADETANSQSF